MTPAVATFVLIAVMAALLVVSAAGCWRNVRRYREARAMPPLHGVDLRGARVAAVEPPRPWPAVDAVDAPESAGYASLADDRVVTLLLWGDLLTVVGGAGVGVGLALLPGMRALWPLVPSVVSTVGGIGLRHRATRIWVPVSEQYAARYEALTAKPAPERPPRGPLAGWRRRGWVG